MTFGPPARFMEMIHSYNARRVVSHVVALFAIFLLALGFTTAAHPQSARTSKKFQNYLVPRRSIQIHDGFGINSDLPRDPYVPWNRWWWTRIFDAGISFIRIGQYENSSDPTSWDWSSANAENTQSLRKSTTRLTLWWKTPCTSRSSCSTETLFTLHLRDALHRR